MADGSEVGKPGLLERLKHFVGKAASVAEAPPMAPIGDATAPKTVVMFVHGFASDWTSWKPMLALLEKDAAFAKGFCFDCFSYATGWFNLNPTERIPSIGELGQSLGKTLDDRYPDAPEVILVGHSQGGLIVQSFMANRIKDRRGQTLARVRQAVLFATPNRGSEMFAGSRRFASGVVTNDQEMALRVLNPEMAEMARVISSAIVNATKVGPDSCPIAFSAFWGLQDNVVTEASAKDLFVDSDPLPGNHFTIIQPRDGDARDERYLVLRSALLRPVGTVGTYEMEAIELMLKVSPYPAGKAFVQPYGGKTIYPDNVARRTSRLQFSRDNRRMEPYEEGYITHNLQSGYVDVISEGWPNIANEVERSTYKLEGRNYTYKFLPQAGQTNWLELLIYDGFSAGNRNWHYHIPADVHCQFYRLTLDLTDYQKAGFDVSPAPSVRFIADQVEDAAIPGRRAFTTDMDCVSSSGGCLWTWEKRDFQGGALELEWDIVKRPGTEAPTPGAA